MGIVYILSTSLSLGEFHHREDNRKRTRLDSEDHGGSNGVVDGNGYSYSMKSLEAA